MQGMVLLAESILGSIGELHAGSSPVQDTTIETRLRFLERVSEVFLCLRFGEVWIRILSLIEQE